MDPKQEQANEAGASNMKKKVKTSTVLGILFGVVVFGILVYVIVGMLYQTAPDSIQTEMEDTIRLGDEQCPYETPRDARKAALDSANVLLCECIDDDTVLKESCQRDVQDAAFFNEAVRQSNPAICEQMKNESGRNSCMRLAGGNIDRQVTTDLQGLADLFSLNSDSRSVAYYEDLVRIDPENVENLLALALGYAYQGLEEQERGGSQTPFVEQAFTVLEKAQALAPEDAEVYRVSGYIHEIVPDPDRAIESYGQALLLDPENILAYVGRAHAYSMVGSLERALEDLQEADKRDPDNVVLPIYSNLCRIESSNTEYTEATKQHCRIIIETEQTIHARIRSEANLSLAQIFLREDDLESAYAHLLNAETITPDNPNVHVYFANYWIEREAYDESIESANRAIALAATRAAAYHARAYAEFQLGNFQKAIDSAETGLSKIDDDVSLLTPNKTAYKRDLYYILANIYFNTGDAEKEAEYKALGDAL